MKRAIYIGKGETGYKTTAFLSFGMTGSVDAQDGVDNYFFMPDGRENKKRNWWLVDSKDLSFPSL
jgi:hypothetical protein